MKARFYLRNYFRLGKYSPYLLLLFLSGMAEAQYEPLYNQYIFNSLLINPACAGNHENLNATVLYRRQWVDIDGAPSTYVLSVHSPIPKRKIALGLLTLHDKIGVTGKTGVYGVYAYRIKFKNHSTLSFGLQGGVSQVVSRFSQLQTKQPDDPDMSIDKTVYITPELGTGIFWYSAKYALGISVPDLAKLRFDENGNSTTYRHHFIHGSYTVKVSSLLDYVPVLLVKHVRGSNVQVDVNNLFVFNDVLCVGINYRSPASLNMLLQAQITHQLQVGYAYEIPVSHFSTLAGASHEVKLSYRFTFLKDNTSMPRYF